MTKLFSDDNKNSSISVLPFNIWLFGSMWVLLHVVTEFIFDYFLLLYLNPHAPISLPVWMPIEQSKLIAFAVQLLRTIPFSLGYGFIIGGIEWYLLNRYFEWPKSWIVFTVIGTVIAVFWLNISLNFYSPEIIIFVFFVREIISSGIFGFLQWIVLRKEVYRAYWWIAASALGGFISALFVDGIFRTGILEAISVNYSVVLLYYQAFGTLATEAIKVACLIALLYFTLKQDQVRGEVVPFEVRT